MKIYEYISSTDGDILRVKEIEAEEKEKTYRITSGQSWRRKINKGDIGFILDNYNLLMYLTERDDERYLKTVIDYQQYQVNSVRAKLVREENKLEIYKRRLTREAAEI